MSFGGGSEDAFLIKLKSNGIRDWSTYYGGNGSIEWGTCVVDRKNNIYLAGTTTSSSSIAWNGFKNSISSDTIDAFVVKFNSAGIRQWGSYYGGGGSDFGNHCAIDVNDNVIICGTTTSTSLIAFNGHQNSYGGGDADAFLVKFNGSGQRLWSSYYGGSDEDRALSCIADMKGYIYISGTTRSKNNIAYLGEQPIHQGGPDDSYLVKFERGCSLNCVKVVI